MIDKKRPVVAVCDSNYFEHCIGFVRSYLRYNQTGTTELHLYTINMTKYHIDILHNYPIKIFKINKKLNTKRNILCKGIDAAHPRMSKSLVNRLYSEQQCYCAHKKILLADVYLKSNTSEFLILDIDCLFQKNIDSIFDLPGDFILRFKKPSKMHTHNLMCFKEGCMLIRNTKHMKKMFCEVSTNLQKKMLHKVDYDIDTDHIELGTTFNKYKLDIDLNLLPIKYKDTSFHNDTIIWSGKGDRKDTNTKYKSQLRTYYNDIFHY